MRTVGSFFIDMYGQTVFICNLLRCNKYFPLLFLIKSLIYLPYNPSKYKHTHSLNLLHHLYKLTQFFTKTINSIISIQFLILNQPLFMNTSRTNYHKKNQSSTGPVTALTSRRPSHTKDKQSLQKPITARDQHKQTSQPKSKQKFLQQQLTKRMSFQSPNRKLSNASASKDCLKNFTLLNYIILRQKNPKITDQFFQPFVNNPVKQPLNKSHFTCLQVLGKGGFGRVMKVQQVKSKKIFAMKEMSKTVIITKKSIQSVLNERQLLSQLHHPFLVNMIYAFQDRSNLFLIMDYLPGGDLRYQIGKWQRFPQHIVKFFVCCILLGLEYMHSNHIIHRDIKPQNIIIDQKGYLRLTDMGIARVVEKQNFKDTSGTPGYMAPEVINRENHSFQVDYFALGVIAYQCMLGKRPYRGYNRQQIRQQILLYQASIKKNQIPQNWSHQSADCINKLLKRKPSLRLGHKGIREIMSHPWFLDIDWEKMAGKKYPSPFMPNFNDRNYDTVSVSEYDEETQHKMAQNELLLRRKSVQQLFEGYEYQQTRLI